WPLLFFFFSSRRRHTSFSRDWSSDVCSSDLLRDSEIRFRQLFDEAPVALALIGGDAVIARNKHWYTLFGYSAGQMHSIEDWWRLAYPDDDYRRVARAAWDASVTNMPDNGNTLGSREYRVRCANGEDRHVLIGGAAIGQELMVSFHDMTEQHQAQQALARLNDELEQRVQARTAELEQAVQHLSRTQQDLVRSEKLAGLGSLVAGI